MENIEETPSRLQAVKVFTSLIDTSQLILVLGTVPSDIYDRFRRVGYQVVGVEEDPELCQKAREQGFDVIQGAPKELSSLKLPKNIGAIWAGVAYAHTSASDFSHALEMLHLMLPSKGALFVAVPKGEGEGMEEGHFVQSYNEQEFAQALEEKGFKLVHQESTPTLLTAVATR